MSYSCFYRKALTLVFAVYLIISPNMASMTGLAMEQPIENKGAAMPFIPILRVDDAEEPVRLKSLDVCITIQNSFAEVDLDMLFFNPTSAFSKPNSSSPCFPIRK